MFFVTADAKTYIPKGSIAHVENKILPPTCWTFYHIYYSDFTRQDNSSLVKYHIAEGVNSVHNWQFKIYETEPLYINITSLPPVYNNIDFRLMEYKKKQHN